MRGCSAWSATVACTFPLCSTFSWHSTKLPVQTACNRYARLHLLEVHLPGGKRTRFGFYAHLVMNFQLPRDTNFSNPKDPKDTGTFYLARKYPMLIIALS